MDPMVDNSWIHEKRPSGRSGWQSKMMKTKVFMTVAVILAGAILAVSLNGLGSNATLYQSEGVVVDFGGYKTSWTDVDYKEIDDPVELLVKASEKHGYTYTMGEDGKLESVYDGSATYSNDPTHSWGLWYVEKKSTSFTRSEGYGIKASDYTVTVWAYTEKDAEPAVAVDATGTSIYGYSQPSSMVTLSPVCTEIVASMNAVSLIVGTDSYSNYPSSVVAGRDNGSIAVVGTYTDPSYESIMHRGPDMVICDGSQYNQVQVAKTLRNSEVNSVVLYNAEDEKSIIDNIFITGVAMNYGMRALDVIESMTYAMNAIRSAVSGGAGTSVMVTLNTDASPTVAGSYTYVSDMLSSLNGNNVASEMNGWAHLTSEYVTKYNPSCIVILDSSTYSSGDYGRMLANLSPEWKNTDAYKNGNIYLLCEDIGELSQRASPRSVQFFEILARILNPDSFPGGIVVPKTIGNDYVSYLTYTKDLGFGD